MFKLLSYQLTAEFFAWASQLDSTAPLFVVPATFRHAFAMSSMKLRMKPFRHSRKHRKRSIIRCIWLAVWFDLDWALLKNLQNQFLHSHVRHPEALARNCSSCWTIQASAHSCHMCRPLLAWIWYKRACAHYIHVSRPFDVWIWSISSQSTHRCHMEACGKFLGKPRRSLTQSP